MGEAPFGEEVVSVLHVHGSGIYHHRHAADQICDRARLESHNTQKVVDELRVRESPNRTVNNGRYV